MNEGSNGIAGLRVLLMQLPVPNNPTTNIPLAAGYLKAYAQAQGLLERATIEILPRALADHAGDALLVEEIVARQPHVLGLSLYTWNSERSLGIAARAKARLPGLLVVVGGPEVQRDNEWVLRHPAVDIAVIGEGEQTFAELLRRWCDWAPAVGQSKTLPLIHDPQSPVAGIAYRNAAGELIFTPERAPLADLAPLPSPYLLDYLEPGSILMVEISRWCPYSCGFCLYGRNMGPKLGSRYFPLERVLNEIRWGRERGAIQVHFVEANLNLVPLFWPLMRALEDLNADGRLGLYAELRGEHLTEQAVAALARAGLRVAEVGLQTANPLALKVAHRKTDLQKWAAGTRRLASHGIEIYLDVILGLPADDADGVAATLDFIQREDLGPYDIFTLQVLPGTETRRQVVEYGLVHQQRPPYYILATDRLSYAELRRLRRELKFGAGLDPDEIEGCPPPRLDALAGGGRALAASQKPGSSDEPVSRLWLEGASSAGWDLAAANVARLARHVDIIVAWPGQTVSPTGGEQPALPGLLASLLALAIDANPSTLFDCYLVTEAPPELGELRAWRAALPYQPGYLDRVAVYRRTRPEPDHERVSPRLWLVLPWTAQADPRAYDGVAQVIWAYDMAADEEPPFHAWEAAGGAGVWVRGRLAEELAHWQALTGQKLWRSMA